MNSAGQTCRLEQSSVDLAKVVINMHRTHPVAGLGTKSIATGWVGEWWIKAVDVPVMAAVVASNYCASAK